MKNFRAYPLYIQTFSSTHLNEYVFVSLSNNAQSFSFQNFVYFFFFFFFSIYYRSKIHGLEWFRDCVTAPSDRWIFDRKLTEIRLIEALCSRHGSLSMLSFPDRSFKYTYPSCFDSQKNDCINGDRIWRRDFQSFQLLRNVQFRILLVPFPSVD